MFTLVAEPTFQHAVPVMVPVDGGHAEQSLLVTFAVLPREEVMELFTTDQTGLEFCRRAVRDVGDIVDGAGQPVAWDEAVKAALFSRAYVVQAMIAAYWRAISKVKAGN
jgi:hypothetical protein